MKKIISSVLSIALIISTLCSPASASSACSNSSKLQEMNSSRSIAYMDLEQASEEMQAQIIEAREEIIYSQSWVADGLQGYVFNEDGIIVEEVPQFSELFPSDWEIPFTDSPSQLSLTSPNTVSSESRDLFGLFSGTLELSVPPTNSNTPSFYQFNTTSWSGHTHYNVKFVSTQALRQFTAFTLPLIPSFNVGYTDITNGRSLGWKTEIKDGYSFGVSTPAGITVAVRASMNNPNPGTTSGEWLVTVDCIREILN